MEPLGFPVATLVPGHQKPAGRHGQRAVFQRVGRELMKDHHQGYPDLRPNHQLRPIHHDAGLVVRAVGRQDLPDDLAYVGTDPLLFDQQVVRLRQCVQPSGEGVVEFFQ